MRYGFLGKEAISLNLLKNRNPFIMFRFPHGLTCIQTVCILIVFLVNKQCIINTGMMHEWGLAEILPDLFQPVPVS